MFTSKSDPEPSALYDLYVVYAPEDESWATDFLIPGLAAVGVRIASETSFALGAPLVTEIERMIQQSRYTLLIISPAFSADLLNEYAELLAMFNSVGVRRWNVIPLLLANVRLPPRLAQLVPLNAVDRAAHPTVLARLCKQLGYAAPAAAAHQQQRQELPPPPRHFFGRDEILTKLV
ncbi:MAG: toll/interleukin-1 receptor domain-containing protein, partial [Caldilineaceae bacterium]|nr:toll/interleukin-1 receptor domain-containing protein [Caldilineaceae bacterium]